MLLLQLLQTYPGKVTQISHDFLKVFYFDFDIKLSLLNARLSTGLQK